ncbi:hypothetical protein HYH03_000260 [Edaphochlamys debaryana]|uniref:Uncharacterized protein n=1 Tax=Edaphochlamys debaryana TaxID=47281 RepID=A0A836C6C0_9CHLO|nr:hypothetical protein HYH03_000260 [Edaphochlamys debaryana]|eukprot:KAG2501760.1 hypothetical protein HYH03_000260 [Edaphochlamys debaryana]
METDAAERYAAAALFTLALHTTQVETGVDEDGRRLGWNAAWGCSDEELFDDLICVPESEPWPGMEVPRGFWGFDCCAPQGMCRRVYAALGVSEARWSGLLKVPDVSDAANAHDAQVALLGLVRRYSALLDPAVAPLITRAVAVEWPVPEPAAAEAGAPGEGGEEGPQPEPESELGVAQGAAAEAASAAEGAGPSELQATTPSEAGAAGSAEQPSAGGTPALSSEPGQGGEDKLRSKEEAGSKQEDKGGRKGKGKDNGKDKDKGKGRKGDARRSEGTDAPDPAPEPAPEPALEPANGSAPGEPAGAATTSSAAAPDVAAPSEASGALAAQSGRPHEPTHKSVLSLYELIGACLQASAGEDDQPTPDPSTSGGGSGAGSSSKSLSALGGGGGGGLAGQASKATSFFKSKLLRGGTKDKDPSVKGAQQLGRVVRRPLVRWYDARARVALRRYCHWLGIPASKMHAMEQMWALQSLQLGEAGGLIAEYDFEAARKAGANKRYITYLKISAGALGGAALLALTGGLAAPAIAAGLGGAIMVLHGGAAAATTVAAMGATTAGTAAITGTFGVIGASHAASKTADLYGDLQEFGFWNIAQDVIQPVVVPPSPPGEPSAEASGSMEEGSEGLASPRDSQTEAERAGRPGVGGSGAAATSAAASTSAAGAAPAGTWGRFFSWKTKTNGGQAGEPSAAPPPASGVPAAGGLAAKARPPPLPLVAPGGTSAGGEDDGPPTPIAGGDVDPQLAADGLFVPSLLLSGNGEGPGDLFLNAPAAAFPPPSPAEPAEPAPEQPAPPPPLANATSEELLAAAAMQDGVRSHHFEMGDDEYDDESSDEDLDLDLDEHGDPWAAETVTSPSAVVRARIVSGGGAGGAAGGSGAGADGAYVEAVLAEMDAEAADLDGDAAVGDVSAAAAGPSGGAMAAAAAANVNVPGGPAAGLPAGAKPARVVKGKGKSRRPRPQAKDPAAAGTAASSTSSLWQWFRSSKQASAAGAGTGAGAAASGGAGPGPGSAAATAAAAAAAAVGKPQLRPLLRVPVNPKRSGDATLALTIAVNGWVKSPEDFVNPWRPLPSSGRELWGLVWESDVLRSLGGALRRFIRDKAIEESSKMAVRLTVSTALITALMLPFAVISAINITIGSRWRVALRRAQLAGRCLAHLLMQGAHGDRPVTLIGFSMGARLIFHCLLELSRCGARGLVESAVLLGTPVSANEARWAQARTAVSGRLVNAFSSNDWVLGVIFRAHSRGAMAQTASGLGPVAVPGIENINLSNLIGGHTQYLDKLEDVLSAINLAEH